MLDFDPRPAVALGIERGWIKPAPAGLHVTDSDFKHKERLPGFQRKRPTSPPSVLADARASYYRHKEANHHAPAKCN